VPFAHWDFLIISVVFVAIYVSRETGTFGGAAIRVLDDVLITVALLFALHAAQRRGAALQPTSPSQASRLRSP
jgi:hypothetical protein